MARRGLAVAAAVELLTWALDGCAPPTPRALTPVLAATAVLALFLVVCLPYAGRDIEVVALRYQDPHYNRVDRTTSRPRPSSQADPHGERVMNNANDGSSYGYVIYSLRIVVNQSLGSSAAPYMAELLNGSTGWTTDHGIHDRSAG